MPTRPAPASRRLAATALLACLCLAITPAAGQFLEEEEQVVEIANGFRITVAAEGKIFLEVRPLPGDGYSHFAIRYAENRDQWREIKKWNDDPSPVLGRYYRIPMELLRPSFRYYTLRRIFPSDRSSPEGWIHTVGNGHFPPGSESLWRIAHWFTGAGERFRELAQVNEIPDLIIRIGQEIRIPNDLLLPLFRRRDQVGGDGRLLFERDSQGEFARYELRRGEALYSAVVIRYTGRVDADEVNRVADVIARRSGIDDVTRIPSGYPVMIPKELLRREFLPPGDIDRIEHELLQAEVESVQRLARSGDLKGVYIILDPGHGGIDVGTMYKGVKERDYVYDIMCRVKRRLEQTTAATVLVTVKDEKYGFRVTDARKVDRNGGGVIMTRPPYRHNDSTYRAVAVNLRWYLANSYYRDLVGKGVDPEKIVFTSIHADSLHPAVRGATF
jgi:N-acetylmuramoyl-L-alanine amidase